MATCRSFYAQSQFVFKYTGMEQKHSFTHSVKSEMLDCHLGNFFITVQMETGSLVNPDGCLTCDSKVLDKTNDRNIVVFRSHPFEICVLGLYVFFTHR